MNVAIIISDAVTLSKDSKLQSLEYAVSTKLNTIDNSTVIKIINFKPWVWLNWNFKIATNTTEMIKIRFKMFLPYFRQFRCFENFDNEIDIRRKQLQSFDRTYGITLRGLDQGPPCYVDKYWDKSETNQRSTRALTVYRQIMIVCFFFQMEYKLRITFKPRLSSWLADQWNAL